MAQSFASVRHMQWRSPIGLSVFFAVLYGCVSYAFAESAEEKIASVLLPLMSLSFLGLVPFVIGFLAVYWSNSEKKGTWGHGTTAPLGPLFVLLSLAFLLGREGVICIILALPVTLPFACLGGWCATFMLRRELAGKNRSPLLLTMVIFLPHIFAPLENQHTIPSTLRVVKTQIEINTNPRTAWQNIERVRAIQPDEQHFSLVHMIGFPRPVEATLSHPGVGGVRHATFAGGVLFIETITRWEPEKELVFAIKADPASIPPTTLDPHVTIGGQYFDVLEGRYWIEPVGEHRVILHLESTHRLSTRFNFYSRWWSDFIMRDIQNNILKIIRQRCEVT